MLFVCQQHGRQGLAAISPRFRRALDAGTPIPAEWVCLVLVRDGAQTRRAYMDVEHVLAAGLDPPAGPLVLVERDVPARQLNDRLAILRLFPGLAAKVDRACTACLEAALPLSAPHLQVPPELADLT